MASMAPAKSQPLHNFSSLSCLKWNSHPRNPRSPMTARRSSSPRQSVAFDDSSQGQSSLTRLVTSQPGDLTTRPLSLASPPLQTPISGGCFDGSMSPPPSSDSRLLSGPSDSEAALSQRQSPIRGGAGFESDSSLRNKKTLIEYRRQSRNSVPRTKKNGASSSSRSVTAKKLENQPKEPVSGNQEEGKKENRSSRIVIKLPPKEKKDSGEIKAQEEQTIINSEIQGDGRQIGPLDGEKPVPKTWNFRPRKKAKQVIDDNGRAFRNSASPVLEKRVQSTKRNHADKSEAEKGKKKGLTIALSRPEIEADIFALVGSKPRKRPKKRSKTVQEQLDSLFPGVWLQSITVNSYKVSGNPGKG